MQNKASYINSIIEALSQNPNYNQNFNHRGENALLFLDLSNILCRAHDYSVWIDIEDLVHIFSTLYNLKGSYAFTSCNLTNGMVNFLYNTGFIVYQSPFDSDALMGFTICNVCKESDVELVLIGTHDGGFRGVSDQLAQKGIHVAFLGFRDMFSSYLKSGLLFYFEDMKILSPLKETETKSQTIGPTEAQPEIQFDPIEPTSNIRMPHTNPNGVH